MTAYDPPLAEIRLALETHADLAGLQGFTPKLVAPILEEAGRLARDVLAPLDRTGAHRISSSVVRTGSANGRN